MKKKKVYVLIKPIHACIKRHHNIAKTEKGNRVILLPQFIVDMLADYINRLPYIKQNERIFPCTKFWLFRHMKLGCKLSGAEQIRIHDLRHSHASLLIEMVFLPYL